ncbi:acetylserotonin O-methyltransferase [Streptomyces sp. 891-h]|uniref:acetylserotonin O-methyltransferase n=1 Tax=unclassified Streptomyces TaxID=2593676 RepID=UPI001FA9FEC2|nr:acetylserotonin O-methyltransferase [Streptomyces sp. 891-h]UNZ20459.1 methyltransferase domain-containing protein [Streptomyces sp. 891-h]
MPSSPPGPPPSVRVLQLATSSWLAAAVSAAAELGVADALAAGPRPVEAVAEEIDAHPPTLHRLLRACAALDLVTEQAPGEFALTQVGEALRSDSPTSMRNFARWVGLAADRATWVGLADSVRTGDSAFERVHGQDVWDFMRGHPEVARVFDDAMTEASRQLIAPVVDAYDFGGIDSLVDVAGGRGALLAAVLAANPGIRGTLYDQPGVVEDARQTFESRGVGDRVEIRAGDIFASVPEGGDAYLLSNVIHDWNDERSEQILANCRRALPPHGRVLLVEAVMPAKGTPPATVTLMDLNMLLLCDGRQRTEEEFAALFSRVGLRLGRIVPAGLHSVVEAVPA